MKSKVRERMMSLPGNKVGWPQQRRVYETGPCPENLIINNQIIEVS